MKFLNTEEIRKAIQKTADEMNIEIVDIECKISKNPSLTIFCDTEDGIDLNTLEVFHRTIEPILDDIDVSSGASYTLNVSSPGLDRPFKSDRDFEKHLGLDVEIKLYAPIKGVKYFEGTLIDYDGKNVKIKQSDGEEILFSLTQIAKINEAIKFEDEGDKND